LPTVCIYIRYY